MSIALIGIITFAIAFWAVFKSGPTSLAVMCCASLFGAASAVAIGGANITPGHLAIGFLGLAVIIRAHPFTFMGHVFAKGRLGIYLLALALWGLASAFLLPRLFAGQFLVFPMNSSGTTILQQPLYPSGANLNQTVYFLSGPIVFALVSSMARSNDALNKIVVATIITSTISLAIVLVDTITFAMGIESVLDFVRNADYAQHFGQQLMGIKRVTGFFPEPSTFAFASVMLFAFNFRLWRGGYLPKLTGPIALFTLIALIFSFSSTGYAALLVYLSLAYAGVVSGLEGLSSRSIRSRINRSVFVSFLPFLALAAAILVAIRPELLDPVYEVFDSSITNKLRSDSGVERSSWNISGLQVFMETFGLGAGTGSVRTSSFAVSVLANLGVIGAMLFGVFFLALFRSKPENRFPWIADEARQVAAAARAACFTGLIAALVSSASLDLGILFFVFSGIASSSYFYRNDRTAMLQHAVPDKERSDHEIAWVQKLT